MHLEKVSIQILKALIGRQFLMGVNSVINTKSYNQLINSYNKKIKSLQYTIAKTVIIINMIEVFQL